MEQKMKPEPTPYDDLVRSVIDLTESVDSLTKSGFVMFKLIYTLKNEIDALKEMQVKERKLNG